MQVSQHRENNGTPILAEAADYYYCFQLIYVFRTL